jgi:hypothetical protein
MFVPYSERERLKCGRCGDFKPVEDFSWRRRARGQRDSFCRPCRAAYGKEHYAANRQRYIAQARKQKQRLMLERTSWLIEYFRINPCGDCGETDPIVLEFDHLHDKSFAIGPSSRNEAGRASSTKSRSARWCARIAIVAARHGGGERFERS